MNNAMTNPLTTARVRYLCLAIAAVAAAAVLTGIWLARADAAETKVWVTGDIADCSGRSDSIASFLDNRTGPFLAPGDLAYPDGTTADFMNCYDPRFGVHKNRTYPAAGNHEYHVTGAADYFAYFGARAGTPGKGWYSVQRGNWQIITLNSNCWLAGGCGPGSAQYQWLQGELNARPNACRLVQWHHPRFTSHVAYTDFTGIAPIFQLLYDAGTELVMQGHAHHYERFAPMNPSGQIDNNKGIRTFVVGTGGASQRGFGAVHSGSQVRRVGTYGLLGLTLSDSSYSWEFHTTAGPTLTDTGSGNCHSGKGGGPVAPVSCSVSADGGNGARVDWVRAQGDSATAFVVERSRNGGTWYWAGRVNAPSTSFSNGGLADGSTFTYRVRTLAGSQTSATRLCSGSVTPGGGGGGPVAPVSCSVSADGGNGARVDWVRAQGDSATAFVVERSRNGGTWYWAGRVNAPSTSFSNGGLADGSTFTYRVRTLAGSQTSATRLCSGSVTPGGGGGGPVAPVSCSVSADGGNGARVDWVRAQGDSATAFVVERSRNGGTWYWAGRVNAPSTSFSNGGLADGSTFTYRVLTLSGSQRSSVRHCSGSVSP